MGRRTLLLIAALVVAALGTVLIFLYVKGINDRALEGQNPVSVLVATAEIPAGTTGDAAQAAGLLEKKTIAADSAAPGALSDITPVADQVALAPIFTGQQILQQQFGPSGSAAAGVIPEGKVAISIQLGDPQRAAAFLDNQPGTNVAIFLTAARPAGQPNAGESATQVLLPTVPVIATGGTTTLTKTQTNPDGTQVESSYPVALLTLAVDQAQAQKIIFGQTQGELYFAILTDKSVPVAPGVAVDARNLFQ